MRVVVGWAAFLIGVECLVCLFFAPRGLWSTVLAALFLLCFLTVGWSVGASTSPDSRKATKP